MLTGGDIKKLLEVFATKQDLKEGLGKLREEFNFRFDAVMNKLDAVYGELKDFRQEQTVHSAQHRRIDERLEKLESSRNLN